VRAMHVTVVVLMVMIVIVVAVRTVHVRLLGHRGNSVIEIGRNYLTLGLEKKGCANNLCDGQWPDRPRALISPV